MARNVVVLLVIVAALAVGGFGGACCLAEGGAKAAAPRELGSLWSDLAEEEPVATRAILAMAKTPEETTVFLAARVKPVTLSRERLDELLVQLGSEEQDQWQAAYRELEYFDPRLAIGLEGLMDLKSVQTHLTRCRLVDVLAGLRRDADGNGPFDQCKSIVLRRYDDGACNFFGSTPGGGSFSSWAEARVERLNMPGSNPKREWTRVVRALALLESLGTEEATAVIDAVAAGHPDAQPTKVANEMLARLTRR